MDLSTLSATQLRDLIRQAEKRKKQIAKRKPAAVVRKKIEALVRSSGYTVAEILGTSSPRRATKPAATKKQRRKLGKVAPKYRNPDNPEQTWTGRGQQPNWLRPLLAAGKSLDDFKIS
jgi:DNA-binding protein H-NS